MFVTASRQIETFSSEEGPESLGGQLCAHSATLRCISLAGDVTSSRKPHVVPRRADGSEVNNVLAGQQQKGQVEGGVTMTTSDQLFQCEESVW